MARRMLINALYPEECRVAIADNDQLLELEVERADTTQLKGNIYKAPITRIEPSLQAAFLDIGSNRNGFLQINDINPSYYLNGNSEQNERGRVSIQNVLRQGQELVVQVVKDERAAKGATLTTNLSVPGRYLVLMVGNQRGGVSRKINDEGQRRRLRQAVQGLKIPAGMGVIVRTAGINKSTEELQADLDAILDQWFKMIERSQQPGSPTLLYKESDLALRTIRDYLTSDIEEILIDEPKLYESALEFARRVMPGIEPRLKHFDKPQPLFTFYHLDGQVEETNQTEVTLPSGGSIVINVTEAIVSIDVNSGRSTGQSDVENTAFETNKEAAFAAAKQLRLRDLGGLIVIDFIDMIDKRHKQIVEKALKDAVRYDKAKIEIGRISKFGLLELSRQRLKSSLMIQHNITCSHCRGRGRVRTIEAAVLDALRKIQSAAFAGGVNEIRVHMAPSAALMLLNDKRQIITQFEALSKTRILVYADGRLRPEEYQFELVTAKPEETKAHLARLTLSTPIQGASVEHAGDDDESSGQRREGGREGGRERGYRGDRRGNDRRNQSYGRGTRSGTPNNYPSNRRDRNDRDDRGRDDRGRDDRGRDDRDARGGGRNRQGQPRGDNRGFNDRGYNNDRGRNNDRRRDGGYRGPRSASSTMREPVREREIEQRPPVEDLETVE